MTFHPTEVKYTLFSNAHGTFSKIDHMVGHEASFKIFKKIEIISSIFLDHNGLKLETKLKEKTQTFTYTEPFTPKNENINYFQTHM